MSEIINNSALRLDGLASFTRELVKGGNGKMFMAQYQDLLDTVTPEETMQLFDLMLVEGFSNEMVKAKAGKIINSFYKSLMSQSWEKPPEHHFLSMLMAENRGVEKIMANIKVIVKSLFKKGDPDIGKKALFGELKLEIDRLKLYELHYQKKENILFSYIEKVFPQFRCLQLMWSFHDDFRRIIKNMDHILASTGPDMELIGKELGKLFFVVLPIIFREEKIVFPVAYRSIPANKWDEMLQQSSEVGWCYIEQPAYKDHTTSGESTVAGKISLGTGFLTPEQLTLLFNNLPVDITFVDENDEVCYFSGVKHRIFPRSTAIIGRKVQNCHPPESVHIVNEIVTAFRNGEKDHADFWIQMKGRFIHIRYFAIRDEPGIYKGTIEVSQDVSEIRQLEGERRLLDWNG